MYVQLSMYVRLKMCIVLKSYIICLNILSDQSQNCSDNLQFWLENVPCPTTISSTAHIDVCTETILSNQVCILIVACKGLIVNGMVVNFQNFHGFRL